MRNPLLPETGPRIFAALALWLALALPAVGAAPAREYAGRLGRAEEMVRALTEPEEPPAAEAVVAQLEAIRRMFPAGEEIDLDGQPVRVDNSWLHTAIGQIVREANGDVEQRYSRLTELEARLGSLQMSVERGMSAGAGTEEARARLGTILARPEYRPDQVQESSLRNWVRKIRDMIRRFLEKVFGNRAPRDRDQPVGGGGVARVLVAMLVLLGLIFGVMRWLRYRRSMEEDEEEEADVREALGEVIPDDVSASDMLDRARELAQRGEYRPAIRRAYLSLLIEMEQRGKLRLHRSKTNRDYLDAMRIEPALYPGFSAMTGDFESVWYGEQGATAQDFSAFIDKYQETTRN